MPDVGIRIPLRCRVTRKPTACTENGLPQPLRGFAMTEGAGALRFIQLGNKGLDGVDELGTAHAVNQIQ